MFTQQLASFKGDQSCIRVVGHRGARGIMPENTLLGFEWTMKMGVSALEFDVMITKDHVPVIVHNHHLNGAITRTAEGQWLNTPEPRISELTYDELAQYDVGGLNVFTEYGQRFPEQIFMHRQQVPKLADLLALAMQPDFAHVGLMLEIKSDPKVDNFQMHREETVAAVADVVRQAAMTSRTILHSFDWELLHLCQQAAPEMPTSFLSQLPAHDDDKGEDSSLVFSQNLKQLPSIPKAIAEAGGYIWAPHFKDVTLADVQEARNLGLLVAPWTVNDPKDMGQMIQLGVDAIVTDYPARLQRELIKNELRWQRQDDISNATLTSA
ncbi:glycerophosphodiester phosphodiesterase family protein [Maritalea mediterranea]|uniref:GP-PDE domain-containing protein n=1 Tax=Maritalea mediterranea TaxID=2909667 RepID=A0ABS9E8U6_9HYPH|nr:glycerophosphodiester phosphodiesterase family protein [Maritalea mediterranea]MCF4099304.1 hypothetical protein [Maritalea mediterranea]